MAGMAGSERGVRSAECGVPAGITLVEIDSLSRLFAAAHADLSMLVGELNAELERVKRKHMPELKRLVVRAKERRDALEKGIQDGRHFFVRPRSFILNGIKVGFQKAKGGLTWSDTDRVVELIHKHYGAEARPLLHIIEKPDKTALAKLPAADLKKLGCEIEDAGDQVLIKPADSEVDKIVSALLKDSPEEAASAAA
jgi:hypothetical protein